MGALRIWVARPEPGASRTGARLVALGHAPLVAPVLAARPTGLPLPPESFDALVLTSAQALPALSASDRGRLAGRPVFAVGPRTAASAAAHGLGPIVEGTGDAADLARALCAHLAPGASLLFVAGAERKPEPAASLARAGFPLRIHVAYAAEPVAALPPAVAEALPGLDAALHYSRRSAEAALDLVRAASRDEPFRAIRHYCLSDDVALPLAAAGCLIHFVAARPREDDLLAGLR